MSYYCRDLRVYRIARFCEPYEDYGPVCRNRRYGLTCTIRIAGADKYGVDG